MTFISARICLETKWRTQRFFLLTFALLEATAGLAIAQAQDAKVAPRLRIEALRQLAEVQIIQPLGNAEPQTPAEQFDRMIFQQDQSPDAARAATEPMLTKEIVEIDRSCALSPAQKHKLFLMGRGDIKRFFDRFETLKEKYLAYGQFDRTMNEDIISIQIILGCGLIHDDCLLHKSLPKGADRRAARTIRCDDPRAARNYAMRSPSNERSPYWSKGRGFLSQVDRNSSPS